MTDTKTSEQVQVGLEELKKQTLSTLIALGKELEALESKQQEFLQLFKAYDALATPKERQVYQQMMGQK